MSVIIVDWSDYTRFSYVLRDYLFRVVGKNVKKLIMHMMDVVFNFDRCEHCRMKFLRNIRISGHSLAAHTAGWIGYLIKYETGYCIGIIYGNFIYPYTAGRRLITLLFFPSHSSRSSRTIFLWCRKRPHG